MKPFYKACTILIILVVFLRCSDKDQVDIPISLIKSVTVFDIANNFNGSDLYVELGMEETTNPIEVRIYVVQNSITVDEGSLASLPDDNYQSYTYQGGAYIKVQLKENLKDIKGNAIEQDVDYMVLTGIAVSGQVKISSIVTSINLTNKNPLEGGYKGTWDDNFYTNFPISARIDNSTDTEISGPFYYTSNFRACCGGRDDGSIVLTLDGNNITVFRYDQDLLTYMGGCIGTYTGSGKIVDFRSFQIDFTGSDCDGAHTGGRISLTKVN